MDPERWRRVEQLYHAALEHEPGERSAFLAEACGAKEDLRRAIEALLTHEGSSSTSLTEQLAPPGAANVAKGPVIQIKPGSQLGPYLIEDKIGAGGMGEVFRALDTRLGRTVALKVLAHDKLADPDRKARF